MFKNHYINILQNTAGLAPKTLANSTLGQKMLVKLSKKLFSTMENTHAFPRLDNISIKT